MKLPDILRSEGDHVWLFTRYTTVKTIADAHRRIQSAVARPPHNKVTVEVMGCIITDMQTYESEPAVIINVQPK